MTAHPDWLAVGSTVRTVRRAGFGRGVVHEADVIVTRHTTASVFADYVRTDGTPWADPARYKRDGDRYVLTPRYLDYIETLEPRP